MQWLLAGSLLLLCGEAHPAAAFPSCAESHVKSQVAVSVHKYSLQRRPPGGGLSHLPKVPEIGPAGLLGCAAGRHVGTGRVLGLPLLTFLALRDQCERTGDKKGGRFMFELRDYPQRDLHQAVQI